MKIAAPHENRKRADVEILDETRIFSPTIGAARNHTLLSKGKFGAHPR
jgi:hypothetical protein